MSGATGHSTRVVGRLDLMTDFAGRSERRAEDISTFGIRVNTAVAAFNTLAESSFQVQTLAGEALIGLGHSLNDLDSFVSEIAGLMRQADSGAISLDVAKTAVGHHLVVAANLERTASDITTAHIREHVGYLDAIRNHAPDGVISMKDLRAAAEQSDDPRLAAAARWLAKHPKVFQNIDLSTSKTWATEDGRMIHSTYSWADGGIDLKEIQQYETRRAAYRIVVDNFDTFDSAATGKRDGRVSAVDFRLIGSGGYPVELKRAATFMLENSEGMNGYLKYGDELAGLYNLDEIAKSYAEPQRPLPPQKNGFRDAVCGVAGYYSYLGWADLVLDGNPSNALQSAGAGTAGFVATATTSAKVAKSFQAAKLVIGGNVYIAGAATVVDGVCRLTKPAGNWGTIKPLPYVPPKPLAPQQVTPLVRSDPFVKLLGMPPATRPLGPGPTR